MPVIPLSLKKNVAWTFLGNAIFAGCKWLIIVTMAKIGSPEMIGKISLGIAIVAPIIAFTELQLKAIVVTDVDKEDDFEYYFGIRIITVIFSLIIILFILIFINYSYETALVILLIGLERCAFSLSNIIYALYQKNHRMDKITISLILKSILSLLAAVFLLYFYNNIIYISLAIALVFLIILFFYDIPTAKLFLISDNNIKYSYIITPRFNYVKIWNIVTITFPLGIAMMLVSLNANIPRYFIEHFSGTHSLGIYAAIAAPAAFGDLVISAISQSSSRHFAEFYARGNTAAFQKLLFKNLLIAFLLVFSVLALTFLAGREILIILYNIDYAQYYDLFLLIIILVGISFKTMIVYSAITATRKFKIQIPLNAFFAIVITLSCFILIPKYGLYGAAFALIITQIIALAFGLIIIFRTITDKKRRP